MNSKGARPAPAPLPKQMQLSLMKIQTTITAGRETKAVGKTALVKPKWSKRRSIGNVRESVSKSAKPPQIDAKEGRTGDEQTVCPV